MLERMVLQRTPTGQVVLIGTHWPIDVEWSRELLDSHSPYLTVDEDQIEVSVANGYAFYRITGTRPGTGSVEPKLEVVESRLVRFGWGAYPT